MAQLPLTVQLLSQDLILPEWSVNSNSGVLSTQQQLSALRGGTGIDSSGVINGQLLIGGTSTGLHLANLTGSTGIGITNGNGAITITNTGVTSLTGTANQVTVSANIGDLTLSLPQDIAQTSTPTFAGLNLTNATNQLTLGLTGYTTTINSIAPTADRIATIPALSANDTFTFLNQLQTLTNKTLDSTTTYLADTTDNTKLMQFNFSGITTGNTRTLTVPNASGTIAVSGTAPIVLSSTTGAISCPTCLTTSTGNFVVSLNGLYGAVTIVGGGINTVSLSGQTVTVTGTEADTLQSVTDRGATSTNKITLSNATPLNLSAQNPTINFGILDTSGTLSISDANSNPLLTLTDNGTVGTLGVDTIASKQHRSSYSNR